MPYLTQEKIYQILNDRVKDDPFTLLKDLPQPDGFKDIKKATHRILKAIKDGEKILVVGDYDVDGIVSTTIMIEFFNLLGVQIDYIIPNRFIHGYGISADLVKDIQSGIIITVDNGIGAFEAAKICKEKNIDLIITDHHTVGAQLPNAYAIVNPKQKDCTFAYKDICGAQVAWYLCAMIKKEAQLDINMMEFFDILSIAIIADIMPMRSLNTAMVKKGLQQLSISQRVSIISLRQRIGLQIINEEDIGFKIAPLINCASRMKDASISLEFLLSKDINQANNILENLIELNEQRKLEQQNIYQEAKAQVDNDDKVIVVSSNSWNEGIIGIVASKLSDKYKKPSFVFSITNDIAKGSSRSATVHLYNLICKCDSLLLGYGGHKGAAGLSLKKDNLTDLKQLLNKEILNLNNSDIEIKSNSLGVLDLSLVGQELYDMIDGFRPFGLDNSIPSFIFENLQIIDIKKMGKNKEFSKLVVSNGIYFVDMVVFVDIENISIGKKISFIATINKNDFRGNITYNLMFKEMV